MSGTDLKDFSSEFACPYSAGAEFDRALSRAESLAQKGDLEGAIELLSHLEKKYMRAARLFDLLGDLLLQRGQIEAGVRYKTLNEILKGTFRIALEEGGVHGSMPYVAAAPTQPTLTPMGVGVPPSVASRGIQPPTATTEYVPMTAAMAKEFMRQGHYDKALGIYNVLIKKNPEDEALVIDRERARKKGREKKLVGMLQQWLANIERLKGEQGSRI
jgi:tetratricopeptide (TPR) repeat protein